MSDRKEEILVSVCSITYNHAPYIRECLDGFLMQECDFKYEILIHDDASTDGTQDIIKEYQAKYPEIIKPILQTENQWSKGVKNIQSKYNFSRTKGKYIAMCEGDDYWTDPLKLQKQVDFLEKNQDYVLTCTNAINGYYATDKDFNVTVFDILHHNPIKTLTAVFRNGFLNDYHPESYMVGDLQLWLFLIGKGKMRFLSDTTAYYRVLEDSVSARNDIHKQIKLLEEVNQIILSNLDRYNIDKSQRKSILQDRYSILISKYQKVSKVSAIKCLFKAIADSGSINVLDIKTFVKLLQK